MKQAPATAVIVTYNSAAQIDECLRAVRRSHDAGLLNCVVVDNASRDATPRILSQHESWATVIRSPENLGFGRGCNLGFAAVASPYVLFLNPDAVLEQAGTARLIEFLDANARAGIVAPAILESDGGYQTTGPFPTPGRILRTASPGLGRRHADRAIVPGEAPARTEWVCGAALMIRSELFKALGGFDPRFFLYFEETDLCRRAAAAGSEIWTVGEATAHHVGGASAVQEVKESFSGCIPRYYFASRYYYLRKHFGLPAAVGTEILEWVLLALSAGTARLRGRTDRRFAVRLRGPMLRMPG